MQRIAEQVQKLMVTKDIFKKRFTTFTVRRPWRICLKQETASYMKFSKELEDNWTCRKKCSPASDKNWSNPLQMPTRRSKEREEQSMVFSHSKKHHNIPKEFLRKIHKKRICTSILDRFQNDEVFHVGQLQHNWTTEWCESLDYVRTTDITLNATPEHKRYATLYHFRHDPKQMERGPIESRPDYNQTTRAIVSMNKEARQIQESKRRQKYREVLDRERLDWLACPSQIWKWNFAMNQISAWSSTQWHHQTSKEEHASGNREAFTLDDRWKTNWWTTSWWEDIRMAMEWRSLKNFSWDSRFRTHVVATIGCGTGAYTHSAHFLCTFSTCDVQTRTGMTQSVCSKQFHISPSSPLHSHVSSAILAVPARSLRHLVHVWTFLAELFPIWKRGLSALPHNRRGVRQPGRSHALHR